jgi:hypothetical protein
MKKTTVLAYYSGSSKFEVPYDLEQVHKWWVKWDTLHIKLQEDDEEKDWIEFQPTFEMDLKRPNDCEIDEVVEIDEEEWEELNEGH